jgi:hypothetical protein
LEVAVRSDTLPAFDSSGNASPMKKGQELQTKALQALLLRVLAAQIHDMSFSTF